MVIFYHGQGDPGIPKRFGEYFADLDEELRKYNVDFEVVIVDLSKEKDEEIVKKSGDLYLAACLLTMKHIFDDLKKAEWILAKLYQVDKEKVMFILEYIVTSRDMREEEYEELIRGIGGEDMPTLAERWIQQGIEQGIQQGIQHGLIIEAQKMLIELLEERFGIVKRLLVEKIKS